MAEEPNQKMDEMLRAYAKKRGEAPLAPLHAATRRMLQEEARRVHGPGPEPKRAGWALWWPRLAFASSLCVVAALSVAVLRVQRGTDEAGNAHQAEARGQLADKTVAEQAASLRQEPGKDAEREDDSGARPAADEPALLLAETKPKLKEEQAPRLLEQRELSLAPTALPRERDEAKALAPAGQAATVLAAPLPVLPDAAQEGEAARAIAKTARFDSASADAVALAPAQAAARPESLARAAEMTNLGAALRTRFVQTNQTALPVMRAFQMEQLGEALRFVDLDGSVYTGQIQRANGPVNILPAAGQRPATVRATAASAAGSASGGTNGAVFSFTANGVNRTLGAPVLVQGQYYRSTNAGAAGGAEGAPTVRKRSGEGLDALLGRTVVGGSNEAPLRAISVER